MKLVVLGATGPLGALVTARALERGHDVTAFVRDPAKVARRGNRLRVEKGDAVADPRSLSRAFQGQDAVVSALGAGKSFRSRGLMAHAAPNILAAMREQGVHRLVWVSAFGVGATRREAPPIPRLFFCTLLRDIYADKRVGDGLVEKSDLDWTVVAPTILTSGARTGRPRHGETLALRGMPSESRADVADFMVAEAEAPRYVRKTVVLSD